MRSLGGIGTEMQLKLGYLWIGYGGEILFLLAFFLFLFQIRNGGYMLTERRDNKYCDKCSEVLLSRIVCSENNNLYESPRFVMKAKKL
jgi:hypothetical protein